MIGFMKLGILIIKIGRSNDDININWVLCCQGNGTLFVVRASCFVYVLMCLTYVPVCTKLRMCSWVSWSGLKLWPEHKGTARNVLASRRCTCIMVKLYMWVALLLAVGPAGRKNTATMTMLP